MTPLITVHVHAIIIWGSVIGCIAVWVGCELLHARGPEVLPPPLPDERDKMAEWWRIMEETET